MHQAWYVNNRPETLERYVQKSHQITYLCATSYALWLINPLQPVATSWSERCLELRWPGLALWPPVCGRKCHERPCLPFPSSTGKPPGSSAWAKMWVWCRRHCNGLLELLPLSWSHFITSFQSLPQLSRKKMAAQDSSATKGDSAKRGPPTVANHFRVSIHAPHRTNSNTSFGILKTFLHSQEYTRLCVIIHINHYINLQNSLSELMAKMNSSTPHFIR